MKASQLSLRHVRYFLEIAKQKSLRKAAKVLNVTESAVSKSLRELEQELAAQLFIRSRKGAHLTAAGEAFHRYASMGAMNFNRAVDAVNNQGVAVQHLKVGALPTAAAFLVQKTAHEFLRTQHGKVTLYIETAPYEHLVSRLRTGELDVIIGRMVGRDNIGLDFELLFEEKIVAVVNPNHPLNTLSQISGSDFDGYTIIAPTPSTEVRRIVDNYLFSLSGTETRHYLDVQGETFSRSYTLETDSIWFAPQGLVTQDLNRGWLKELALNSELLKAPFGVTKVRGADESGALAIFLQMLRSFAV